MTFLGQNEVEVIAGINLPMLFTLAGLSEQASLLEVGGGAGDVRAQAERHLGGLGLAPRREGMSRLATPTNGGLPGRWSTRRSTRAGSQGLAARGMPGCAASASAWRARPSSRRSCGRTSAGEMGRIAALVLTLGTVDEIEQFLLDSFGRPGVVTEVNTP